MFNYKKNNSEVKNQPHYEFPYDPNFFISDSSSEHQVRLDNSPFIINKSHEKHNRHHVVNGVIGPDINFGKFWNSSDDRTINYNKTGLPDYLTDNNIETINKNVNINEISMRYTVSNDLFSYPSSSTKEQFIVDYVNSTIVHIGNETVSNDVTSTNIKFSNSNFINVLNDSSSSWSRDYLNWSWGNSTFIPYEVCDDLDITPERVSLCILLLCFAVSTIFGNSLVLVAVARERYLHTVTNYFIMSLAVADCLVGTLVMPFSALYDSFKCWFFGPDFCDVWHSFDVLASTASILHLCVISLDRYWAITDPFSYPSKMSPQRACYLIALVWVCSALISFPAIAWWRARSEPHPAFQCHFTEDLPYLFFSSTISFYGPLLVMVFTYFRIYRAATEQTRSLRLGQKMVSSLGDGEVELTLRIHRGGGGSTNSSGNGITRSQSGKGKHCSCTRENGMNRCVEHSFNSSMPNDDSDHCTLEPLHDASPNNSTRVVSSSRNIKNFSISRKFCKFAKEKKAAKTLGIVMGVFIVCWLPFFVNNLRLGLCGESCSSETQTYVNYIVTWLGWINSAMNPVIYACWARDFRR